jgi:hypothetical protein
VKALVISHRHHLLPFAWRLKQEGCEVDVIIDRDSYEKAWEGRFKPLFKGGKDKSEKRSPKGKEAVTSRTTSPCSPSSRGPSTQ